MDNWIQPGYNYDPDQYDYGENDVDIYDSPEPYNENIPNDISLDPSDYDYEWSSGHTPCGDDDND